MECALFLDIIVRQSATIFQLFTGKDQPLLIWGNSFLVLDLGLDVLNGVGWFNLQGDSLACQGLDKYLHASPESENKMECALFLDIIVRQSSAIFQLFTGEDQPLLIWGNSLLVLDLGLDVLNGVNVEVVEVHLANRVGKLVLQLVDLVLQRPHLSDGFFTTFPKVDLSSARGISSGFISVRIA